MVSGRGEIGWGIKFKSWWNGTYIHIFSYKFIKMELSLAYRVKFSEKQLFLKDFPEVYFASDYSCFKQNKIIKFQCI